MSTKNNYKVVTDKGTFINYDNKQLIPVRDFCKGFFEKLIANELGLTFVGGINDKGADGIALDGSKTNCYKFRNSPKRYQFKSFFENKSSVTFNVDYSKISRQNCTFDKLLRQYLRSFDVLVAYIGNVRGEKFDKNNLIILENKQEQYEFLFKRGYVAYNGNKAELQFNKTTWAYDHDTATSMANYYKADTKRQIYR